MRLRHFVIEGRDPERSVDFWVAALHASVASTGLGTAVSLGEEGSTAGLYFMQSGDGLHGGFHGPLRFAPDADTTLADEVEFLQGLGADVVKKIHRGWGIGEVIMTDPAGIEFVVESSDAEAEAAETMMTRSAQDFDKSFWEGADVPDPEATVIGIELPGSH
jgi:catechol 2,3-dioxygenase-like lactoylglutathione lyase family enzyme